MAQVLAGAALPQEPPEWQKKMLDAIGITKEGRNIKLARSDPMFDWRLVAAARILSASREQEVQSIDAKQLGDLGAAVPADLEVGAARLCSKSNSFPF